MRSLDTNPASEPPTHAMVAGVKAGALPAFSEARVEAGGGGVGSFSIAIYGTSGRRAE